MWPTTKVTDLLNINLPLIQAPMAGNASTPELIAAVSNAGGLGSYGAGYLPAEDIRKVIKQIKQLTNKPFAINLFIPKPHHATDEQLEQAQTIVQSSCSELNYKIEKPSPPYHPSFEEQLKVILEENIPILSFTFGMLPDHWIQVFKNQSIKLIGTATTLEEARLLEKSGIDMIVAQGSEAGGHRGTFLGRAEDALTTVDSLVSLLVKEVSVPVIAAGGIMDAAGIVTALKLGASAVQMGTAFLCCTESGINPNYKKCLLTSGVDKTTLTRAFSGELARAMINKFIIRMQAHEKSILDYPIQNSLTSGMRKEAGKQNQIDFISMFAGQRAYLCKEMSASQLIDELNKEVINIVRK